MTVRVLLAVAVLMALYGCGQSSPAPQESEKEGGVEPKTVKPTGGAEEETTQQVVGNMPISGGMGEAVEGDSYDLRVLDYFVADRYYYLTDPYSNEVQDYYSEAGHFVVVNYSVTNTSSGTIQPNPIGALHVGTEANIEVYEQSDEILPAGHDVVGLRMDEIPPRQMRVSQFIFDVPTDVDPELVAVTDEPTITSSFDVGVVDLTENEPQGPRPQEIVALMNEYINMTAWEQAYELYSEESKARVSLDAYESRQVTAIESVPASTQDISFPSVDVQENQATVDSVLDLSDEEGEFQDKITYELVLEEDGWRIVMSQKAVDFILGTGEETTSSNASASGSASASP